VNTGNKVGESNFCKSGSTVTHDGNIVVSINLPLYTREKIIANVVVVIFLF
jgi:hypothetical protein